MNSGDWIALAADLLDAEPWPATVRDAVRLVREEAHHAAGCSRCLAVEQLPPEVVTAFLDGAFDPDLADLGAALLELASELRQVEPRCVEASA